MIDPRGICSGPYQDLGWLDDADASKVDTNLRREDCGGRSDSPMLCRRISRIPRSILHGGFCATGEQYNQVRDLDNCAFGRALRGAGEQVHWVQGERGLE